jgi:hypothetical protein
MLGRTRRTAILIALFIGLPPGSMSAQMDTSKSRPDSARPALAARPRERPAMVACPWPVANADTLAADPKAPSSPPTGVIDPPRPRIPDCAPPNWKAPASLKAFVPPALPKDRPKPLVDDYLRYVVTAPPREIVDRFKLDTGFYKKFADANGYPVLASAKVPDAAVAIVRDQVNYMLGNRPDVRDTMIAHGGRVVVMSETEYTVDVPEQRGWTVPKYLDPRLTPQERARYYEAGGMGSMTAGGYWNPRARGMGGTLTTCAEENVLGYYRTRYWGTNICVHEFSHAIMGRGDRQCRSEVVPGDRRLVQERESLVPAHRERLFGEHVQRVLGRRCGVVRRQRRPRTCRAQGGGSDAVRAGEPTHSGIQDRAGHGERRAPDARADGADRPRPQSRVVEARAGATGRGGA